MGVGKRLLASLRHHALPYAHKTWDSRRCHFWHRLTCPFGYGIFFTLDLNFSGVTFVIILTLFLANVNLWICTNVSSDLFEFDFCMPLMEILSHSGSGFTSEGMIMIRRTWWILVGGPASVTSSGIWWRLSGEGADFRLQHLVRTGVIKETSSVIEIRAARATTPGSSNF